MRIVPRVRYWKNSNMNNHVILNGVDVEVIKVIHLASGAQLKGEWKC